MSTPLSPHNVHRLFNVKVKSKIQPKLLFTQRGGRGLRNFSSGAYYVFNVKVKSKIHGDNLLGAVEEMSSDMMSEQTSRTEMLEMCSANTVQRYRDAQPTPSKPALAQSSGGDCHQKKFSSSDKLRAQPTPRQNFSSLEL